MAKRTPRASPLLITATRAGVGATDTTPRPILGGPALSLAHPGGLGPNADIGPNGFLKSPLAGSLWPAMFNSLGSESTSLRKGAQNETSDREGSPTGF
jgi:hypothetical protein